MFITRVVPIPTAGAYFCEDLAALQARPMPVADRYTAAPVTPGFAAVRRVDEWANTLGDIGAFIAAGAADMRI